jgi:hypothetical protein
MLSLSFSHSLTHTHKIRPQNSTTVCSLQFVVEVNQSIVTNNLLLGDLLQDSERKLFTEVLGSILTVFKPFEFQMACPRRNSARIIYKSYF